MKKTSSFFTFNKLFLITALLIVVATPFIVSNKLSFNPQAFLLDQSVPAATDLYAAERGDCSGAYGNVKPIYFGFFDTSKRGVIQYRSEAQTWKTVSPGTTVNLDATYNGASLTYSMRAAYYGVGTGLGPYSTQVYFNLACAPYDSYLSCRPWGDANQDGKITLADSIVAQRIALGLLDQNNAPYSDSKKRAADANRDGANTAADGTVIAGALVHNNTKLRCP